MKILINWNNEIVGNYEINLNNNIVQLLKCVPSHMENLSMKDRYIDTINFIVSSFSFILDKNVEYNNLEFAETIRKYYTLDNLKVKYVYEFLINM